MVKRKVLTVLLAGFLLHVVIASSATAQYASLAGTVVDRWGNPVPGLTVVLFHPPSGMSFQAWTDGWGRFYFPNIPPRPDPYFLQVFWGPNLVFEMPVRVPGHVNVGIIRLP